MARTDDPGAYSERITIYKRVTSLTTTGAEYQSTPTPVITLWARVNTYNPSLTAQAARANIDADISFKIRYGKEIEDIVLNPQDYLVLFKGLYFTVKYTDDYMFRHDKIILYCEKEIGGNNGQRC